ncbi:MAG: site-2 protease family protein [Myxococcales bacterium FL481]|nr:MAG: site-2 protease family protein [Myxococcales bacterium FL481]
MPLALSSDFLPLVGVYVVCLVLSIAVHEYCHALAAARLGDPTPEQEGRLTLNPLAHADPIGTLTLPVLGALFSWPLFGWGRPVPTQPRYYTRKVSMRGGMALVAAAGPAGNVAFGAVVLALAGGLAAAGALNPQVGRLLAQLFQLNVLLCVFNLLPLHPLDGGKILAALLPARFEYIDDFLQRYGGWILIALIFAGGRLLSFLFSPVFAVTGQLWQLVVAA